MFKNKNFIHIITICLLGLIQVSKGQNDVKNNTIKEVPYLVQVWVEDMYYCDGILVSEKHVVTKAHYIHNINPNRLHVAVGVSKVSEESKKLDVAKVSLPTDYKYPSFEKGVAVLTLKSSVKNRYARPIELCDESVAPNTYLQLSGWSQIKGRFLKLRTVRMKSLTNSKCKSVYYYDKYLTESMFCATAPSIKGACVSYTCGAVVANGKLCGIVARNVGCKDVENGTYTDIYKMKSFITDVINGKQ